MAKQTKINFNLDGLEKFRKTLGNDYVARVGILGANAGAPHMETVTAGYDTKTGKAIRKASSSESSLTNSEIGVIHEFGSESNGIPPRSFLRMPIEHFSKEILKSLSGTTAKALLERGDYKGIFALLGASAEGFVKLAFASSGFGQWPPNAPSTVAAKGSSRPLIDSGQLRDSITSDVVRSGDF